MFITSTCTVNYDVTDLGLVDDATVIRADVNSYMEEEAIYKIDWTIIMRMDTNSSNFVPTLS